MSEIPNPHINQVRERMQALGVDPKIADALYSAASLIEVNQRIPSLEIMGDARQILMYTFQALAKTDATMKTRAEAALAPLATKLGLPNDFVWGYLTRMGDYPGIVFDARYGDKVKKPDQNKFREAAEQFMLKTVREYLES
jgi:hypothetical protein